MTDEKQRLVDALLDALTLHWEDNGNIFAEAVRDACIQTLCDELDTTFQDVVDRIGQRVLERQ